MAAPDHEEENATLFANTEIDKSGENRFDVGQDMKGGRSPGMVNMKRTMGSEIARKIVTAAASIQSNARVGLNRNDMAKNIVATAVSIQFSTRLNKRGTARNGETPNRTSKKHSSSKVVPTMFDVEHTEKRTHHPGQAPNKQHISEKGIRNALHLARQIQKRSLLRPHSAEPNGHRPERDDTRKKIGRRPTSARCMSDAKVAPEEFFNENQSTEQENNKNTLDSISVVRSQNLPRAHSDSIWKLPGTRDEVRSSPNKNEEDGRIVGQRKNSGDRPEVEEGSPETRSVMRIKVSPSPKSESSSGDGDSPLCKWDGDLTSKIPDYGFDIADAVNPPSRDTASLKRRKKRNSRARNVSKSTRKSK